jgi:hypothetical protein
VTDGAADVVRFCRCSWSPPASRSPCPSLRCNASVAHAAAPPFPSAQGSSPALGCDCVADFHLPRPGHGCEPQRRGELAQPRDCGRRIATRPRTTPAFPMMRCCGKTCDRFGRGDRRRRSSSSSIRWTRSSIADGTKSRARSAPSRTCSATRHAHRPNAPDLARAPDDRSNG